MLKLSRHTELTRQFVRPHYHPNESKLNFLLWMAQHPFKSWRAGRQLMRDIGDDVPPIWSQEIAGKRVLIMGSGPSLDRVSDDFFDGFDVIVHVNFALRRLRTGTTAYFFTTDLGAIMGYMDKFGVDAFRHVGRERSVLAPVFFDYYRMMTDEGRALFTVMKPDAVEWRAQKVNLGPLRLPLALRYHPVQPDWAHYAVHNSSRSIAIIDHTSALSAVLFAAQNGAAEIGLIGCDFSAGRAATVESTQQVPDDKMFGGAAAEFRQMEAALARQGIAVTNHSWQV